MFSYRWDEETGGIVLTTDQGDSSVEVRPVYARELAMLNMPWMFEMQDDVPYMWARTNQYWYRGRLVAKVHGACMYKDPKIEIVDAPEPPQTPKTTLNALCGRARATISSTTTLSLPPLKAT